MKKIIWRNIIKSIIWRNLIYNIIRCIVAYPFFLIVFVISIPFNIVCYFVWRSEVVVSVPCFIFTGAFSLSRYSVIVNLITDFSFEDLMIVVFPATFLLIREINGFNETLYPIKRSYNVVDPMDMFNKTLEKINRS